MSYNSKQILFDVSENINPIPQFYDPVADAFDPLTGAPLGNGRYGSDTISWGMTTGGLFVPIQVDDNGVQQMSLTGSNAIYNGTYTVTGTGAAISAGQSCSAVLVQNDPSSNGPIYVGGSTGQTISLAPGAAKEYQVTNVDMIFAKFGTNTTTATLNWEARS